MNRHFLLWRVRAVWAALLLVPVLALAQSPHEGIYIGVFQGTADEGEFALIVDAQGDGTLAAYDAVDDTGYIEKNIHLQADGSFQFISRRGVHIHGQATASDVSGRYFAAGTEGSFSGWREAMDGPLQDAAGYYSGPASIAGDGPWNNLAINSRLVAIIAADGTAFFLLDHGFPAPDRFWPGDFDFDVDIDFDFDLDLDLGFGFDLDLNFGNNAPFHFGSGFNPPFLAAPGFCGPFHTGRGFGWPFNFGLDYSFRVSFLGFVDLDFNFSRPTCRAWSPWNSFPETVFNSGGIVQIEPDGDIHGTLLDGLALLGRLDAQVTSARGVMSQQQDFMTWSGHWEIERQDNTGNSGAGVKTLTAGLQVQAASASFAETEERTWSIVAAADFNGDGYPDGLWVNPDDSDLRIWLMNGQTLAHELYINAEKSGRAELAGVGDFNGDGSADILWRDHVAGIARVTLMPGDAGSGDIRLGVSVGHEWLLESVGDLDGDGTDDLIWRDRSTGESIAWRLVDTQVADTASLIAVPNLNRMTQP